MSEDALNPNLYRDTGLPEENPLPETEYDVLMNELAKVNSAIIVVRGMLASSVGSVATEIGSVTKRVALIEQRGLADVPLRQARQRHLDRMLWSGIALGVAHLLLEVARLVWRRS